MTTKEQVINAREQYYEAYRNYIKTAMDAVEKERGFLLMDENSDEDGKPVRIHASNLGHNYEYYPSFDQVDIQVQNFCGIERTVFIFHVVEGDDLFPDNTWVSEDDFSDDRWSELLDFIDWDR